MENGIISIMTIHYQYRQLKGKNMTNKTIAQSLLLISLIGLTGCGSSSSSSDANTTTSQEETAKKYITVVDGYVVGARVKDANSVVLGYTDQNGRVQVDTLDTLNYPLSSTGGYIDVNNNHQQDGEDIVIKDDLVFTTNKGRVISPLTSLAENNSIDPADLVKAMGLNSIDALYVDPIKSNDVELEKANQIAYAILATGKTTVFANNLKNAFSSHDLPLFNNSNNLTIDNGSFDSFYQLAVNSVSSTTANFLSEVHAYNETNASNMESTLKISKQELIPTVSIATFPEGTKPNTTGTDTTNTTVTSETNITGADSTNTTVTSDTHTRESNITTTIPEPIVDKSHYYDLNSTSELPSYNNFTLINPVPETPASDLPIVNYDSNTTETQEAIPTAEENTTPSSNGSDLPSFGH